jgi:hypothetical protein
MHNTTARDNALHAARQLADAANRCAQALMHHRDDIPPGFAWEADDLTHWAAQVNAWAEASELDDDPDTFTDGPHFIPEDFAS